MNERMSVRDLRKLVQLLEWFKVEQESDDGEGQNWHDRDRRINSIINLVIQWVKWHAHDEMGVDL